MNITNYFLKLRLNKLIYVLYSICSNEYRCIMCVCVYLYIILNVYLYMYIQYDTVTVISSKNAL